MSTEEKANIKRRDFLKTGSAIVITGIIAGIAGYYIGGSTKPKPTPTTPVAKSYRIGVITSLTGDFARGGYVTKRGYDFWADRCNADGGISINNVKYPVDLIYYDSKSDPAMAAKAVEKAVSEGVDFLLGPYSSACTLGGGPVAEKYKMPFITGSAESNLIPQRHWKYVFQTLITTGESPLILINYIKHLKDSGYPLSTVAIIGGDDAFSKSLVDTAIKGFKEAGFNVIYSGTYPTSSTDLTPILTKIENLKPDIIFDGAHPPNHVIMMRNLKELGYAPKLIAMHWGVDTADYLDALKKDGDYVIGIRMWSPDLPWKDPILGTPKKFADDFKAVHGHEPDYTEASCAATGSYVQQLLENYKLTPSFNDKKREKMVKALEEFSSDMTILGKIKYSTDPAHWHVNIGLLKYVMVVQIINEKPVPLWPESVKKAKIVFPFPSWSQRA